MPGRDPRSALDGQTAVVTGAARGIGAATAAELAAAGARVVLLDIDEPAATAKEIGDAASAVRADVTDRAAVRDAIGSAGPLDILVTAAGIYGHTNTIEDIDESELDSVLGVNVKGTLWCLQAAIAAMRGRGGRIVCIGSVGGKIGGVLCGPHYAASKGGVHAMVKWAAKTQAAHGILVNGVAPGVTDTDMISGWGYDPGYCPLGRFAEPAEIARVAAFLCTPAASYMTGTVVDVNGGSFMG